MPWIRSSRPNPPNRIFTGSREGRKNFLSRVTPVSSESEPLLRIEDLTVHFRTSAGTVRAVDGVSYDVRRGETLAVVGESGCGKSVTALAVMGLVPIPPGEVVSGSIALEGEDLTAASADRLREIRGDDIAMIFQEPMTSLNRVLQIGHQIAEPPHVHRGLSSEECRVEAERLLAIVGIPDAARRLDEYPHRS